MSKRPPRAIASAVLAGHRLARPDHSVADDLVGAVGLRVWGDQHVIPPRGGLDIPAAEVTEIVLWFRASYSEKPGATYGGSSMPY